ncbi:MAG: NADAR family protein [Patescibacteria group bacterium]|nr:NADAR family protein [Patescibacteria group bacterium]
MAERISQFRGEYRFLSNFHPSRVMYGGLVYPTVENAYQAAKCVDRDAQAHFQNIGPAAAKAAGNKVNLRPDWEDVKLQIMEDLLRKKFVPDTDLAGKLLDTNESELIEENWWQDHFWGICNGVGHNHLGRLLMKIREELRQKK